MARRWLPLKKIDDNTFLGECDTEQPKARVFGGHILAQALMAVYHTVSEEFSVHSVHSYFARVEGKPITYRVERVRDGGSFVLREVRAVQEDKVINLLTFSLQKQNGILQSEGTLAPSAPQGIKRPEELIVSKSALSRGSDDSDARGPAKERKWLLELRPVNMDECIQGTAGVNKTQFHWVRYKNKVEANDHVYRHAMLLYISDLGLAVTGTLPYTQEKFKLVSSLDHSAWLHSYEFDVNDWLLFEQECVVNSRRRSLVRGRIWSRDGRLLVSVNQEILIYTGAESKL